MLNKPLSTCCVVDCSLFGLESQITGYDDDLKKVRLCIQWCKAFVSNSLYCCIYTYFFMNRMYLYSSFQRSSDFLKQEQDVKKLRMDLKKFLVSLIRSTIVYDNIIYGR